jgi:hypothetical protein
MSGTRLRSPIVLLALVACAGSATARGIPTVPAPARQPSVTKAVVYGHTDGLALTLDVHGRGTRVRAPRSRAFSGSTIGDSHARRRTDTWRSCPEPDD